MNEKQFNEIKVWQKETFPSADASSKLFHLIDEIKEVHTAILTGQQDWRHEFADCFMLLFGAAASEGMTYEDICKAIDEKMAINRTRKWGKPDANGVVKHLKD